MAEPDLCGRQSKMRRNAAFTITFLLAAMCLISPGRAFLSTYNWQLRQPEFVEGGIELLCLFCGLCLVAAFIRNSLVANLCVLASAGLYLQIHSILPPAAAAFLYLEILLHIGAAIEHKLRIESQKDGLVSYLARFVMGTAAWTIGAFLISGLGFGTFSHLRIYTVGLLAVALALKAPAPLTLMLMKRFGEAKTGVRIAALFLLVILLMQFGKINHVFDYDTKWYGMRPEFVLIGKASIFDDLKLVHFVYYYPKQFEFLAAPLSNLRSPFITSLNVVLLAITFLAVYCLGREIKLERKDALFVTALAASIPVVANMASTCKTDVLLGAFAFIGSVFFWRWCKERNRRDLAYGIAAMLGMLGTKITAFAYTPMLLLGYLGFGIARVVMSRRKPQASGFVDQDHDGRIGLLPLMPALIAALAYAGLCLRTWILTGVPTLPAFLGIWKKLGITPKYPWNIGSFEVTGIRMRSVGDFATHWKHLLFDPSPYGHYIMAWPGNIAFFSLSVLLIFIVFRLVRGTSHFAFLLANIPIMIAGIVVACTVRLHPDGGTDGNYYIVPVVLALLSGAAVLAHSQQGTRRMLAACGFSFIILYLPIMLVTHWSWWYGTQAFRFSLKTPLLNTRQLAEVRLRGVGAWEMQEYLQKKELKGLCIGLGHEDLRFLSCRFDDFNVNGSAFYRLFATDDDFRKYLAWAQPEVFILPKSFLAKQSDFYESVRRIFYELEGKPETIRIESPEYVALDISAVPELHGKQPK